MKVEQWQLAQLRPYEHNPRLNDEAVDVGAASIREFGFRQPIVVDEDGVIIVGHTRYKAAQKLGLDKVPVHVAKGLTPEQIKAYRIADNKTSEIAEWNYELLPLELSQLKDADFDLGLLGFDADELAKMYAPGQLHANCLSSVGVRACGVRRWSSGAPGACAATCAATVIPETLHGASG